MNGVSFPSATIELLDFPELFERQVDQTPDSPAVYFESSVVSYRQLNSLANQVARYLTNECNVQAEQCVGLCLDKSTDAIAVMLGILKAGASFVPLDPEYPTDRLAFMINDAAISPIICADHYRTRFDKTKSSKLIRPGEMLDFSIEHEENIGRKIDPTDLAYVMYTSGSTGKPKGVQIEHQALTTYCLADISVYRVGPMDRTLQFSTLNFDIAIEEIFPPLLTGSSVVVRPRQRADERNELSSIIKQFGVTAIHLATAYWHEWIDLMHVTKERVPESIRLMVVTGEKVSTEHYRRWKTLCDHDVLWCNAYGPTEATVSSTVFIPDGDWDGGNMPIGKPLDQYTAFILDDQLRAVAEPETGELYIGGPALARGYLNRDDLTQEAFVHVNLVGEKHRLYKTGDLARWLPTGDIEFAGRIDHQIKLGSYRIEPGEIEAAINQCPTVSDSLVSYDEIDGKKHLVAYVATAKRDLQLLELFEFIRDRLPSYMIPARYVLLEAFPTTINGKIDRDALPDASTSRIATASECVPPRNQLETQLVEIYSDILNLPEIGIHDDFFALGGSSLLVTRVITRIAGHLKTEIPVRDFFANPTIATIAQQIERLNSQGQTTDTERAEESSRRIRANLPKLKPLYFESGANRLFGIHYEPTGNDLSHAVVICPSIGHEYARAYRNLQQLALLLAKNGYHVLRFDFAATGNSTGDAGDITADDWLENISEAIRTIQTMTTASRVTLVGVRLGATLAANADADLVDSLLLWDPITSGLEFCEFVETLQRTMLRDLSRFPVRRQSSNSEQAYGINLTQNLRRSISNLTIPNDKSGPQTNVILTNKCSAAGLSHSWPVHKVDDDVFWDHPRYTESAFSSPNTFQTVLEIMRKEQEL